MALSRAIQELIDLLSTPSQEKKVETMSKTDKKPSHVNEPDFENYGGPHIANITAEFQYREAVTPEYSIVTGLKHIHFNEPSEFQDVKVIETTAFGRTLILDLHTQSAEFDEHLYHESLVHPAMISHPNPQTVFIGGGGELATAREVLKHSGVKECIMVDLDKKVVDASLLALPSMVGNVMSDKRLKVEYGDAKAYLEKCDIKFDVIIMDIADPIEAGPGIACYFKSFYQTIHDKLNDNGCFVTQSGPCGFMTYDECFTVIHNTMKSVFKDVNGYFMEVPSFGCPWGWNIGWKSGKPKFFDNMKDIDDQLVKHVGNETYNQLKHYDGSTHFHMFSLPKHLRIALKEEKRVMTKDTPVFMY